MTKARHSMRASHRALILGTALAAASATGCGTDTCTAGDDACILSHLRIYDQGGNPVTLTSVPAAAIRPGTRTGAGGSSSSSSSGGGSTSSSASSSSGSTDVPTVTGWPSSTSFADSSSYLEVMLAFTDPCGERPGGCFGVHHANSSPGSWMTTGPVYDMAATGQWPLQVGFDYTTTANDTFVLDFVAWSSCGGPDQDPIAALLSGSSVAMGTQVAVSVTVDVPVESSGSGGDCVSPTVPDTLRSGCCTTSCPAACADANGNAWYEVGGTVFGPCAASNNACLQSEASSAVGGCGG